MAGELEIDHGFRTERKAGARDWLNGGTGLAAARALAAEGAFVTVNGRTRVRADGAVDALKRELPGAAITGIAADLSRGDDCATLIGQLSDIDVLFNNLGVLEPKPFE